MDKSGFFGEMLEKGQQTVQRSASDVAKSVAGQLGVKQGEPSPDSQGNIQNQSQQGNTQNQPAGEAVPQAASTEETKQFVKEFYAPSKDLPENLTPDVAMQMQQKDKLETQQKLANLRQELHKGTYYEPLTAYEKKKEQEQAAEKEEGAAQRVEKQEKEEEQKKMELEEKKEKEDQDIAKTRAQRKTEANRGVAG